MLAPTAAPAPVRRRMSFDGAERRRLALLVALVALLHLVGFGLFAHYNAMPQYHQVADGQGRLLYAGAASLAYVFGLRHAFDADHIAAIDDSTRLLLQKGRRPLAAGFFFSLGHSTVVFALSLGIAVAAKEAVRFQQAFAGVGGLLGTATSALFLYLIAGFNLVVLVGVLRTWREAKGGRHSPEQLDALLARRGLMNRVFRGRYNSLVNHSWQLYPVGLLFGLGFDTASEVGFLALSATAATAAVGTGVTLPPLAIIALPVIFAAGMSLMDTADGVFMTKAYSWAFTSPLRKIYYNITTTGLSVFVAFVVGSIELLDILTARTGLAHVPPLRALARIDLNTVGYLIVAAFVLTWAVSVAVWKLGRLEQRYGGPNAAGEPE